MRLDLNCDLGEGEAPERTAELLRCVTSANIACGGHAGDTQSMQTTVRLAQAARVRIGAHPGLPDRANFGRQVVLLAPAELRTLLIDQVNALQEAADEARLHHIKLHGALYHMVEDDRQLGEAYVATVRELWPELVIFSIAGGAVAQRAAQAGLKSWGEGFLDRGYRTAARLIPRGEPHSLLNAPEFEARLRSLIESGTIPVDSGESLKIDARTWCIHGDTPHATSYAQLARTAFESLP